MQAIPNLPDTVTYGDFRDVSDVVLNLLNTMTLDQIRQEFSEITGQIADMYEVNDEPGVGLTLVLPVSESQQRVIQSLRERQAALLAAESLFTPEAEG